MPNPIEFGSETLGALRSRVDETALKTLIPSLRTGTITMLFTDIVGSTPLKQGSPYAEEHYFADIKHPHDIRLKSIIETFSGQILNLIGDAFFVGFQGARNAVRCAHAIQEALLNNPIQTSLGPLRVRIGVHTGEPAVYKNVLDNYDLSGPDVDKAWRIMSEAGAEQVFLSPQTKTLAEALVGFSFHSHGRRFLKGLGWNEVFELLWGTRIPRSPLGDSHNPTPGPQSNFVGRTQELETLRKSLSEHRLVTLTASSGMGKTRIAWEISLHSADEPWAEQGFSFAHLDQIAIDTASAVYDALIASLRLDSAAAGGAMAALRAEFQAGPALLILDNCETALESIAEITNQLLTSCPHLRILATSHRPLGLRGVEAVINLGPMTLPMGESATVAALETQDSYQLFLAAARRARVGWSVPDAKAGTLSRLLRLTDGIPLAIELVAAAVPLSSLERIADDLEATPLGDVTDAEILFGSIVGSGPERHLSLLRCFQWSFNHLSHQERHLFTQLSVFAETFTETAARRVCGLENARPLLAGLVRANLIYLSADLNPSRYFMLRIGREFARIKASEAGIESQLNERYVHFFHELATFGVNLDEVEESITWEDEWPDLLAAAQKAQQLADRQAVWQISRALSPFLMRRGLWTERERLNRSAVVSAQEVGAERPLVHSLIDLGVVLEALGRWDDAATVLQHSLDAAQQNPRSDINSQAKALERLGRIHEKLGRPEDATRAFEALQKLTPKLITAKSRSRALEQEGHMLQKQGRWLDAERKYRDSLALRQASDDTQGVAYSRSSLGVNLTLRGDWQAAEAELRKSLRDSAALGLTQHQSFVLRHLGSLFRSQGRYADAQRYLEESVRLCDTDPKGRAVTLGMLARVFRIQRRWADAEDALQKSLEISESLSDRPGLSRVYGELGTTYRLQRRWDEAIAAFRQSCSLRRSDDHGDHRDLAITLDRLAQVYMRSGNLQEAKALSEESVALSQRARRGHQTAITATNLALICAAQGDRDAALRGLDDAIAFLRTEKDNRLLPSIKKLRDRIERLMRPEIPWTQWAEGVYIEQLVSIRRLFDGSTSTDPIAGYKRLIEEFTDAGQTMEAAIALNELGSAYRRLPIPNYTEGATAIQSALSMFEDQDLTVGKAAAWHKLGNLHFAEHELEKAENAYAKSLRLKREILDDEGEAITLDHLADIYLAQGRFDEAEDALERSREILRPFGTTRQRWITFTKLIELKKQRNDVPAAIALARAAVTELTGDGRVSEEARTLLSRLLANEHYA